MHATPTAQPCRCAQPLRDRETCLYCGRSVPAPPENGHAQARVSPGNPWTRAGVVRAFKAFAFFRGRAPGRNDWSQRMPADWPPLALVEQLFGSLPDALSAAGLAHGE